VAFLIEVKKQRGPYLVIVPLSTMTNWSGEFAKWAPSVKMIAYKERRGLQAELRMGHHMKNTQSKLAQTLTTYYHSCYHLILTGTPLQNNLPELSSLLNFVLPKIFIP
jgi:ATP-dependent helicase STH1/SNF2